VDTWVFVHLFHAIIVLMNLSWLSWVWVTLTAMSDRRSCETIAYLQEENSVLRELLGTKRLQLNDHQRRRLALLPIPQTRLPHSSQYLTVP